MATPAQSGPSKEELIRKLKEEPKAWNEWWMGLGPEQRGQMDLQRIDLSEAYLQGRKLCDANLKRANLQGADLRRADLTGAKLGLADLRRALLGHSDLSGAQMYRANLRRANLQDIKLNGTNLLRANLRETNLRGTNLSVAKPGLLTRQVAGADLTGATLPEPLSKLYEKLGSVNKISDSAKKVFLALLGGCLYSWLTIATTTDSDLITNRASSPLPIIQTAIPIVGFYVVAPIILLCFYFYFHFYLQKLWEELAHLPAVFPDGKPLYQRADPWLFNDLVRAHFSKLRKNRPFLSKFQSLLSILLAWGLVPITLLLFWGRYLPCHDMFGTLALATIVSASTASAFQLYRLARQTLEGHERTPFTWSGLFKRRRNYYDLLRFGVTAATLSLLSIGAVYGTAPWATDSYRSPRTWIPAILNLVHYSPFANLTEGGRPNANLSGRNLAYATADHANLINAKLDAANLDYSQLNWASLSGSNLEHASLKSASLRDVLLKASELRHADLEDAHLEHANFEGADLTQANLRRTWLSNAKFDNAIIKYADLRDAADLTMENISSSKNYEQAFLPPALLNALGLPPAHNEVLQEYLDSKSQEPFDLWQQKRRENKVKVAGK